MSKKIYDFDGAFDKKIGDFMQKRKGKYTKEQWEDIVAEQYKIFSDTTISAFGCTPKQYYSRMSEDEILQEVNEHLTQGVPIDDFLRSACELPQNQNSMVSLLHGNEKQAAFAFSILGDRESVLKDYLSLLSTCEDEELCGEIVDVLKPYADRFAKELVKLYSSCHKQCIADVLQCCEVKSDEVYFVLIDAFRSAKYVGTAAERLAQYGDERAVKELTDRLSFPLDYNDWHGIKYAVESLGGKVEDRDYSNDKDYIKVQEEEERLRQERENQDK